MLRRNSLPSKFAASGLLVLALASGYVALVEPIVDAYRIRRDDIARKTALIEQYRERAAGLEELQRLLANSPKDEQVEVGYLTARNRSLASAKILSYVKDAVRESSGTLSSANFASAQGTSDRLVLRAQMTIAPSGLQRAFHKLESGAPVLFIDNVLITRQAVQQNSRARQTSNDDVSLLNVQFDLYGFFLEADG